MSDQILTGKDTDSSAEIPEYIVGIGASAGGLSALEKLFDNMPTDSGMAFVIIQHLSPDFKSLMDDLLARHTSMPIHRVTSGIELRSDNVYLIPPKNNMRVKDKKLFLTEKPISPNLELPIDIFFNSLAEDAGDRAIAVILSGTGTDGSRGVRAVNEAGGLVIVQSPESAQFDGMPRSAIATNSCDIIVPPEHIPRLLASYVKNPKSLHDSIELEICEKEGEYATIFALLRRSYNLDFSKYKAATVERRIRRRMEFRQVSGIQEYASIISGDHNELDLLYRDLLIGVTEFFRDPHVFEFLEQEVIPSLYASATLEDELRAWSAACATGEEAYSLAILLSESAVKFGFKGKITVFATDVHKTSLDFASQGLYEASRLTNVSHERLERYFKKEGNDYYRVTSDLRKMVVFAPHNLLSDPPFTKLDLVCCRNLLIYLQPEVQDKIISLFHFALKRGANLVLGSSEGLGSMAVEFDTLANHQKIYRKIRDLKLSLELDISPRERNLSVVPVIAVPPGSSRLVTLERQLLSDYDTLLHRHMPPGVLINENRQVLHFFGDVFKYFNMREGRAENNLLNMAGGNLNIAISAALQRAEKTNQTIVTRNVRILIDNEEQFIDLTIAPLPFEKSLACHYHIYFERIRQVDPGMEHPAEETDAGINFDVERQLRQYAADLEMELMSIRENLQATVEELQTSNEELQATNEEMLAANEELQSTNEELHSVNEELYSVNAEFERKNLELKELNSDHDNLLSSIDVGTVFLDKNLRIRKYNKAISGFFKLLPQDIGRPIDHIAYHLSSQSELLADIRNVLESGEAIEKEEPTENRWLLHKILPFFNETGHIEGVVLTFTDITTVKESELQLARVNSGLESMVTERTHQLQESEQRYRLLFQNSHTVKLIIDPEDGAIVDANKAAVYFYGWDYDTLCGMKISTINILPEATIKKEMAAALSQQRDYFQFTHRLADGSTRDVEVYSGPIAIGGRNLIYSIINDITRRKAVEDEVKRSRDEWVSTFDAIPDMIYIVDDDHTIIRANKAVSEYLNLPQEAIIGSKCNEIMHCSRDVHSLCPHEAILQGRCYDGAITMAPRLNGYFDLAASAVKDSDGNRVSSVLIARDVTAKKMALDEQAALEQQLHQAQKLETIGQLAGGIAHDFNNKLMVVLGNSQLAGQTDDLEEIRSCLGEITKAAEHSRDITMQLLAFSRKQMVSPRIVNANTLIGNTSKSLKHLIGDNIGYKYELAPDLWPIRIDPVQLDQIIVNLAINARDAMPDGGNFIVSTGNVRVTEGECAKIIDCTPGDYIRISFRDNGIGMDDYTLKHLFEPFYTTKALGKGTGLGLATVFGIVRQNDGFIDVKSSSGEGSTFDVYFPRQKGSELQPAQPSVAVRTGSGTILLIEDDESLNKLTAGFLRRLGYSVFPAATPSEAIRYVHECEDAIELIVADVMLPEMSGVQLVKEIQKLHPDVSVLYISGFSSEHIKQEILKDGLTFLQKPVNLNELSWKIHELIAEKHEIIS